MWADISPILQISCKNGSTEFSLYKCFTDLTFLQIYNIIYEKTADKEYCKKIKNSDTFCGFGCLISKRKKITERRGIMDSGAAAYKRFLSGDDYGLEQVIGLYKDSLIFFLLQYVKSPDLAEELTEDVFVALAVKKPDFSEEASFKTWLFTIARNKALNCLRSPFLRRRVPIEQAETGAEINCPEKELLRQERFRALYSAMERLPENQRELIYLVYFEDMKVAAAAKIIRKTSRQASNILSRARKSLKEILEKEGFGYEIQS